MTSEEAQRRLRRILSNEGPLELTTLGEMRVNLSAATFPAPGLVFVALHTLLALPKHGPGEKMAWSIEAGYGGVPFAIQLEKFGLRLYVPSSTESDTIVRITAALAKCCSVAEEYLRPAIREHFDSASVTIENQFSRFEEAYRFFRTEAQRAYASPPPPPVKLPGSGMTMAEPFRPERQGGYLASAMLDTYFSRLEHVLVLLSAFSNLALDGGGLRRFMASFWDAKFKALFPIASDNRAKGVYDHLKRLKEDLRNPASHGGFLKDGESLFFHSPAGALPVALTRRRPWEFHITPVPPTTFEEVCTLLDATDAFLETSPLSDGVTYIQSGLDVRFDSQWRWAYHEAAGSDAFQAFLSRQQALQDQYANLDF